MPSMPPANVTTIQFVLKLSYEVLKIEKPKVYIVVVLSVKIK